MNYLYHIVPEKMKGNILMPLNKLKKKYPDVYEKEVKKYSGRKHVMKKEIPVFNCKWNDVLHLTAVNPKKLKVALKKAGGDKSKIHPRWFKIKPSLLDKNNLIINKFENNEDEYENFEAGKLKEIGRIPKATVEYYVDCYGRGERPLLFVYVPHILYKGLINKKDMEIIEI